MKCITLWSVPRFLLLIGFIFIAGLPPLVFAATVDELREELKVKREALQGAEERIKKFREDIQIKKQEAQTLEGQIGILDSNITELELEINRTEAEIEEVTTEIETIKEEILQKEEEIRHQKQVLSEYIRALHAHDQQSTVTIFLKYQTFAEAMSEAATISELQNRGQETLVLILQLRDELDGKRRDLEDFKQTLEALKARQENQHITLETQRGSKQRILDLTNSQEQQYQQLLREAQTAHQNAESQIRALDQAIREELRRQGVRSLPSVGVFDWPIDAIFGVSCEFHCSGYPYEYLIGKHSGTDIPTYVGTPIRAPADGYLARYHDAGGPGYSYILMLHGDNISTVYGHVSGFAAAEGEMVTRGTVIGYTGGAPGTRGAGLSSGPHLHFEVRENNIPINPRNYL